MSLAKEKSKRVLLYYASPPGEKYGYFVSTNEQARTQWLKDNNHD